MYVRNLRSGLTQPLGTGEYSTVISAFCTLGTRALSHFNPWCTLGTRKYSIIAATGPLLGLAITQSFQLLVGTLGTREDSVITLGAREDSVIFISRYPWDSRGPSHFSSSYYSWDSVLQNDWYSRVND